MNKRLLLVTAGILGLFVVVAAGWYLGSPIFIDDKVEEAFPFETPNDSEIAGLSDMEREAHLAT